MRYARKRNVPVRSVLVYWRHAAVNRLYNRWYDLRAWLAGYCNHSPYRGVPGQGGGYAHWRCALRRGHYRRGSTLPDNTLHRVGNYAWPDSGETMYYPNGKEVHQPRSWYRRMQPTIRQERARRRWYEEDDRARARRAARVGGL